MGRLLPKFKPEYVDESPVTLEQPSLHICKIEDGFLSIPGDTRSKYISCPIRGPEWRALLQKFDQTWSRVVAPERGPSSSTPLRPTMAVVNDDEGEGEGEHGRDDGGSHGMDSFDWSSVYADEPKTKDLFDAKYPTVCHRFTMNDSNISGVLVEGPKLFIMASGECECDTDTPIVSFGAGTWVLDARAQAFLDDWGVQK